MRPRSVAARAPLREEQPAAGLRTATLRHQLDPHLDPWIGLEHFHMTEERRGARPLAGFSLVTYLFEDSRGALVADGDGGEAQHVGPGGLHWLEAGAGCVHACRTATPGRDCHGVRMLINLHADHELVAPRRFTLAAGDIPEISSRGARVRVLLGSALGARSPLDGPHTPVTVLDVRLDPGAELVHLAPRGHHAFALAIVGSGHAGPADHETPLLDRTAVAFAADGDTVRLRAGEGGLHALIGHAAPLRQPVVWSDWFAMSSPERLAEVQGRFPAP